MNIFVLDSDPAKAAEMLCDSHVVKMCVETAQILSGVMLRRGRKLLDGMPKPQNINHPVIVAAEDTAAANWLSDYNFDLLEEFRYRFGKEHCYQRFARKYMREIWYLPYGVNHHHFDKCCGDLDVAGMDIVSAYRKYYTEVKKPALLEKNMWKFTNREDWTK